VFVRFHWVDVGKVAHETGWQRESEMKKQEQLASSKCSQTHIFISPKFNHSLKEAKDKE